MSVQKLEIVGKNVKDMYGAFIGKVIGTITDIDGSVQTVGIDCGSEGLRQIPFEQLVIQNNVIIFIPKWRLESQRLLREKELTLRRLKALVDIVSDNDEMKEDASIIYDKYKTKLATIDETQREIKARLETRLSELTEQIATVKMIIFDARVQFKSNEITQETFDLVKHHTNEMIEHITHESSEIENIQRRIADLSMEVDSIIETQNKPIQDSAVSYLKDEESQIRTSLPEAPTEVPEHVMPMPESSDASSINNSEESEAPVISQTMPVEDKSEEKKSDESDWLARMEAQSF